MLLGLSIYSVVRGELHTAHDLGEQLLSLAQRTQEPVLLVEAHYSLGVTCFWLGEFASARDHLQQGIARYDPAQHAAHLALYGQDGGPVCLCRLALVLWYLGYPDQALVQGHAALAMVEELAHPFSRAYVLLWLALLYNHRRVMQADPQQQTCEAEASLLQALHVARGQRAKLPELRAAMSLCRLWCSQKGHGSPAASGRNLRLVYRRL